MRLTSDDVNEAKIGLPFKNERLDELRANPPLTRDKATQIRDRTSLQPFEQQLFSPIRGQWHRVARLWRVGVLGLRHCAIRLGKAHSQVHATALTLASLPCADVLLGRAKQRAKLRLCQPGAADVLEEVRERPVMGNCR